MIAGWAVGAKPFTYPAQVGMPLSMDRRYLVLQVREKRTCRLATRKGRRKNGVKDETSVIS